MARSVSERHTQGGTRIVSLVPHSDDGEFDPAVVVLTALVDGYAEVSVNGQLPRPTGLSATIQGFNVSNRVVLTTFVVQAELLEVIDALQTELEVTEPSSRECCPFRRASCRVLGRGH